MNKVTIPITIAGRKYGYIIWKKKDDWQIEKLFGEKTKINLYVGNDILERKIIDWKRRRVSITYTLTRNLPTTVNFYVLERIKESNFRLSFALKDN